MVHKKKKDAIQPQNPYFGFYVAQKVCPKTKQKFPSDMELAGDLTGDLVAKKVLL
jgi:hypothetical protein